MDIDSINRRIAQFETMVRPEADPDNDMAWFSLAGAYKDAHRLGDSARAYRRVLELNAGFSKAWQMLGQVLADDGKTSDAITALTDGYKAAAAKGDRMPMKAMGDLLTKLGAAVPEVATKKSGLDASTGTFLCKKTGRNGHQLPKPPFKGAVGQWIYDNISAETWDDWIRQGTKVINELRLDLSRDEDSEKYDAYMREYVGIDDELLAHLNR
jgi:Fe-S cluster biosynthesis and repair protein YggX